MAQSAVGRLFRCQNASLRQSIGSITQKRGYQRNAIPTFPPTSSPELDKALNRIREELFIPFGLTTPQRKLMSRQKYADRLDEEPVTVTIGENDEQFILRPMDPQSRPTKKEIMDTIALMKTPADWQNVLPFLAGLKMSHRTLKSDRWEWLTRRAGQADALGVLIECAKRSDITGLRLNNFGIVKRFFFELHQKAQKEDFKGPAVTKALSLAQQAVSLMESPEHIERNAELDPKRKPFVVGTLLELSAARALDEFGGKDEGGHVVTYARRLLATWPFGNFQKKIKGRANIDQALQENVPILNAMKLALQFNEVTQDKELDSSLKRHMNDFRSVILAQRKGLPEAVKQKPTLGYQQTELLL